LTSGTLALILEGILTTLNEDGTVNVAPMGPIVDAAMTRLVLRPFTSSTTYQNFKRTGEGVFHVTDDVELLAQAAVGQPLQQPKFLPAAKVRGMILESACRWYALRVETIDDSQERTTIVASVVDHGRLRDFFGFNRAKHAILEAAILATRVHLLGRDMVLAEFQRLQAPVEKTGGPAEKRAFEFLFDHVRRGGNSASGIE
jgi:uncharacterized protein